MSTRNSKDRRVMKQKLAKKRGHKCARCGKNNGPLTLDHKIPLSKGGTWKPSNLQLLCRKCNEEKADKMPWELDHDV